MKPFTFADKTTTEPHSCSPNSGDSPENVQRQDDQKSTADHCFRAKPCPKNLFSNYFYHKMWEDEYFRALNRKLRAEELLKVSSLPPSMRRREHADTDALTCSSSVIVQPATKIKSERSCSAQSSKQGKRRGRRTKKKSDYCHLTTKVVKAPDFITTCPQPFEFETAKRSSSRKSRKVKLFFDYSIRILPSHPLCNSNVLRLRQLAPQKQPSRVTHLHNPCTLRLDPIWRQTCVSNGLNKSYASCHLDLKKRFQKRN